MKAMLEKITAGGDLSFRETEQVMGTLMDGNASPIEIAALLVGLKTKGETAEEVAGAAKAMRERSIRINKRGDAVIDVCGTGGDNSGTINISTAVAFVVAATGIRVAKHGNRSISSRSGSADVLKALGVNINLEPRKAEEALEQVGIAFLFAPDYHPAMKHVAPVRRELGMKTIFNMLGPLTNPAGAQRQLIGTYSLNAAKLMCEAAGMLDMQKVCFVCTADRYDEVILSEPTDVFEFDSGESARTYQVDHRTFGYPAVDPAEIGGDTPDQNAEIMLGLFKYRKKNAVFYVTAANAAMALQTAGYHADIGICLKAAEDAILSGAAMKKLDELRTYA
jgi:anthranilate phosphoribosyltransferase